MAYSPPAGDAVAFVFSESYAPPSGDAVPFNFSGDTEVVVSEGAVVLAGEIGGITGDLNVIVPEASIEFFGEIGIVAWVVPVPEAAVSLAGEILRALVGQLVQVPEAPITLAGSSVYAIGGPAAEAFLSLAGATGLMNTAVPTGEGVVNLGGVAGASTFDTSAALIRYYLTVTGAADGLPDIELPMASFQARRRSGDPTYLSVVIPSADFAQAVAARPNGSIRIDQGYDHDGNILQREPIMDAPISDAAVYNGGRQSSIVLTGYGATTYTPKSITLTDATYRAVVGGKIRYRLARPYIFLNPGDTVTIEDDTFIIGTMSYAISPAQQQIELQEA